MSKMNFAYGDSLLDMSIGCSLQGAPGMFESIISARKLWQPRHDYVMALQCKALWLSIDHFTDVWASSVDVAARMSIGEWIVAAGIVNAVTIGTTLHPKMQIGLGMMHSQGSVSIEVRSEATLGIRAVISSTIVLLDSVTAVVRLGADPLYLDAGIRFGIGADQDLVLAVQNHELLGIQPRVSLCLRSPSWLL